MTRFDDHLRKHLFSLARKSLLIMKGESAIFPWIFAKTLFVLLSQKFLFDQRLGVIIFSLPTKLEHIVSLNTEKISLFPLELKKILAPRSWKENKEKKIKVFIAAREKRRKKISDFREFFLLLWTSNQFRSISRWNQIDLLDLHWKLWKFFFHWITFSDCHRIKSLTPFMERKIGFTKSFSASIKTTNWGNHQRVSCSI